MKHFVLTGPGRILKCSNEKFIVDFALGIGVVRQPWHSQQSKSFYENLRGRMVAQYCDLSRGLNSVFTPHSITAIPWLTEFIAALEPGYLVTRLVHERLIQLGQTLIPAGSDDSVGYAQREKLRIQLAFKRDQTENRLRTVNLLEYGRTHYEQVLSRWSSGDYFPFSPAGRCYTALQELYWGPFGEAVLLCEGAEKARLIDEVRSCLIDKLASEVNASSNTRHYYHAWLTSPCSSGVLEYKEALAWLGDACNIDQQPVSYSVTQAWRGISLGMPRICSAMRLGGALVDEFFLPD